MKKFLAALLAAAMLAVAMPVNADTTSSNVDWMLNFAGLESMPEGVATVNHNGETFEVSIADAIAMTAARAGDMNLAALSFAAAPGDAFGAGDVWVLEIGGGSCPAANIIAPSPAPAGGAPQATIYNGYIGTQESSGSGIILDLTTKLQTGGGYSGGVTIAGISDFWCIGFFGIYIYFPFIDGVATSN